MIVVALAALVLGGDVDRAALRALLQIPYHPPIITVETDELRAVQAADRLSQLSSELLKPKREARVLARAGQLLALTGDAGAPDYYRKALTALETEPKDDEHARLAIDAEIQTGDFDAAQAALELRKKSMPDDGWTSLFEGEVKYRRVMVEAQAVETTAAPERLLDLSLAALRDAEKAKAWQQALDDAGRSFRAAAIAMPKEPRAHRDLAMAINAKAYVDSALLWTTEQKTTKLMPIDAMAHWKAYAGLLSDDPIAQHEAYDARRIYEREQGITDPAKFPKEGKAYLASLKKRFEDISTGKGVDAKLAAEIRGVLACADGDSVAGLQWVEQAKGDVPNPRLDELRFAILFGLGRFAEAASVGDSLWNDVHTPTLALALASCYDRTGAPEKASTIIVEALTVDPEQGDLRLARAVILLRDPEAKGLSDVSSILNNLAGRGGNDQFSGEVAFVRGLYYGLIGDVAAAKRAFDSLNGIVPAKRLDEARKALG